MHTRSTCNYIHTDAYTHAHYVYLNTHLRTRTRTLRVPKYTLTHTHVHTTCTRTNMHTLRVTKYALAHTHTYKYTLTHTLTHIYACTLTHTHAHHVYLLQAQYTQYMNIHIMNILCILYTCSEYAVYMHNTQNAQYIDIQYTQHMSMI